MKRNQSEAHDGPEQITEGQSPEERKGSLKLAQVGPTKMEKEEARRDATLPHPIDPLRPLPSAAAPPSSGNRRRRRHWVAVPPIPPPRVARRSSPLPQPRRRRGVRPLPSPPPLPPVTTPSSALFPPSLPS